MAKDEIKAEPGQIKWDTGRYQPPASAPKPVDSGGFGSLGEPVFEAPPEAPHEPRRDAGRPTAEEVIQALGAVPAERVNLDAGSAAFMGYEFLLSPEAVQYIRSILAAEVCLTLDREKQRIALAAGIMFDEAVQEPPSGERPNLSVVPEPQGKVGKGKSKPKGEMP